MAGDRWPIRWMEAVMHLKRTVIVAFGALAYSSIVLLCLTRAVFAVSSDDVEPVPLEANAPKLVAVWPGDKAKNVDPITELHLRFDQPIEPLSFQLEWLQGGYLECGHTRYLKDKNELVIPIRLEADCQHKIVVNSPIRIHRAQGFVSADGSSVAQRAVWQFHTKAISQPADSPQPKAVSIHPRSGSTTSRVTFIRVRFDQPMDPLALDLFSSDKVPITSIGIELNIELNSGVSYNDENNEFMFPVVLPPNWTGELQLSGLRSHNGVVAPPITIRYSTGDEIFSQGDLRRLVRPDSLAKLRNLIENVRRSRGDLRSVSETVHMVTFGGKRARGQRCSLLEGKWSRFKMQGERQFYGDVSQVMGIPFQIGSDGTQCWFYSHRPNKDGEWGPMLITCEYDDIQEKSLLFLDPFDFDGRELTQVVKDRHLEYLGVDRINDMKCHVIGSWNVQEFGSRDRISLVGQRWWIDSKTFRPIQMATESSGGRDVTRYRFDSINQQLPLTEFQPTIAAGTAASEPEPLGDGYDTRFLKLSDGTNGRMSCRWGKTGAKGSSSPGLN
jgi:outer membrane lipoprotein-sorting protein